jgi:hypothetical protein
VIESSSIGSSQVLRTLNSFSDLNVLNFMFNVYGKIEIPLLIGSQIDSEIKFVIFSKMRTEAIKNNSKRGM